MNDLKKYNTDALFNVPLVTAGAADFKNGPTLVVGDCKLRSDTQIFANVTAESMEFVSLSELPVSGDTLDGVNSGASGTFMFAVIESGTIGSGSAAGTLFLKSVSGTFQGEDVDINGGTANVMSVEGNLTAGLVAEVGARNIVVALTAAEMSCKQGVIHLIDSATKEWEDQAIHFSTFGHANAEMAVDFSDAVRFGLAALPNAAADASGGLPISGAGALDLDAMNTAAVRLTAARAAVLTDWINGGRLDLLLDAIPVTEMRGTNNAATSAKQNTMETSLGTVTKVGPTKAEMNTAHGLLATEAKQDVIDTNVDTLVTRLTATRAAKLDNVPGSLMPTQAEVLAIQNNTRTTISVPQVAERPDSGSTQLKIYLNNYDMVGNMEAPDSAPTVTVVNETGTTRNGNLQHPTTHAAQTTMVNLSTGRYWIEYDLDNADALESLTFTFSVIEGGVTRTFDRQMLVVDTTAVDFTAADRAKLDTLHDTRIPGVIQPQTGDSFARLGAPAGANVSADIADVPTVSQLNARTLATGSYFDAANDTVANVTLVGSVTTKTGYELAAAEDVYHADIDLRIDAANTRDEYTVTWFKNGVRITSGITVPKIQVVKRSDGTDLIALTAMSQIGSTGSYRYDEATNRTTAGEAAVAIVTATINSGSRSFARLVGRDSS